MRGQTVDECRDRLDAFLDFCFSDGVKDVRVIHGLGTGALRDAIRAHLRRSGYVRSTRPGVPEEGADGVTIVELM